MSGSEERPAEIQPGKEPAGESGALDLLGALEAMLFVSPEPLGTTEIEAALDGTPAEEIERGLDALASALQEKGRGLRLEAVAGGYRLVTRPELARPLQALFRFRNRKRLTPATLDVLAIVSYAQPITAPEIQQIRGTDPYYALRVLQERRLVRMAGRKRVVGRPILYATTREFLVHFGLDSLDDLPPVEAFGTSVVPAQGRLFSAAEPGADLLGSEDEANIGEDVELLKPDASLKPEASLDPGDSLGFAASLDPDASLEFDAGLDPDASLDPDVSPESDAGLEPDASLEIDAAPEPHATADPQMESEGKSVGEDRDEPAGRGDGRQAAAIDDPTLGDELPRPLAARPPAED